MTGQHPSLDLLLKGTSDSDGVENAKRTNLHEHIIARPADGKMKFVLLM